MLRNLLAAAVLAAWPLGSLAEEKTVHLDVQAMPAPKPALKYLLLPEVREMNPGNPVQWYVRCFQEQRNFFYSKEAVRDRARYRAMPLAELPAEQLRKYGGSALTQADWAARLDTPDWQVLDRVKTEGVDLLLPELVPLRILATALQVRFRAQIAGKHYDEAVGTAKTMFALARHLGEYPTETANLVGLSVAELALDTLEEMLQQPGCPNLYWALTDLPCPLVDLRRGLQGDSTLVAADFRSLRNDAVMTDAELEELVSRLSGGLGFAREQTGQSPRSLRAALQERVKDVEKVRAARNRLIEAGCTKDGIGKLATLQFILTVERFSPLQVILLDEKNEYETQWDEDVKLLGLAPWQIDALSQGEELGRGGNGLFEDLLPHVVKVRREQGRLERRIALLRHVEALRLYAAAHEGKLPEKLAEVAVPLPDDPFTGKPFPYKVEGACAHLVGSAPRGEQKNPAYKVHYEVAIKK